MRREGNTASLRVTGLAHRRRALVASSQDRAARAKSVSAFAARPRPRLERARNSTAESKRRFRSQHQSAVQTIRPRAESPRVSRELDAGSVSGAVLVRRLSGRLEASPAAAGTGTAD